MKTLRDYLAETDGTTNETIRRYGPVGSNRAVGFTLEEEKVDEGAMSDLDIAYQDYKKMTPQEFFAAYKISRENWYNKYSSLLKDLKEHAMDQMRKHAGIPIVVETGVQEDQGAGQPAAKAAELAPVGAIGTEIDEESNPTDTVTVDISLLIRLLEFAREQAHEDLDLNDVAERLTDLAANGETLSMDQFDSIVDGLGNE